MFGSSRIADLGSGLATTLGAGLLVGIAPAASVAGVWLFTGLVVAAALAAFGSAVAIPRRFGAAGAVVARCGRLAGAAAVAGMVGVYALPARPALGAVVVVLVVAAIRLTGVRLPAWLPAVGAAVVLASLAVVVLACFAIDPVAPAVAAPPEVAGADDPLGILAATVIWYPAFLGAGRRRVVVVCVALLGYLVVAAAVWYQLGGPRLAVSPAPLRAALAAADGAALTPLLTVGVVVAGVLVLHGLFGEVAGEVAETRRPVVLVLAAAVVAVAAILFAPAVPLVVAGGLMLLAAALGHGKWSDPK